MDSDPKPEDILRPVHLLIALIALVALLWAGFAGQAASLANAEGQRSGDFSKRCKSPGSREVTRSSRLVVYEIRRDGRSPTARTGRLAACVFSTGRKRTLASADGTGFWFGPPADAVAAAGTLVAVPVAEVGDGASPEEFLEIGLTDFRHPRRRRSLSFFGQSNGKVGSIVVTRGARVAWIECERDPNADGSLDADPRPECVGPGRTTMTIRTGVPSAALAPSRATTIASGREIDPLSLRLRGNSITWREAGATRRAELPE